MGIAIAIVAVVALAVIGLVVTARSRATTGRLSRETRKRDEAVAASTVTEAAAPSGETTVAEETTEGRARADEARRAIESGSSQVPAPRTAGTAAVYEPVDLDELGVTRRQFFNRSILAGSGLGLGAFGVAALAFLWPSAGTPAAVAVDAPAALSRLRVSRLSRPVVARERAVTTRPMTARATTATMAMAIPTTLSSYNSKKMPSFQGKTKLKP